MSTVFDADPKSVTLEEAKQWLRDRVNKGAQCPCCSQYARIYKRQINASMAYVLICIERHFRTHADWLHVPSFITGIGMKPGVAAAVRGDFAKLRYWKLIEVKPAVREDGSTRNGYYKITREGVDYVHAKREVQRYIHLFDEHQLGFTGPMVTIRDALKKFNYEQLMSGVGSGTVPF